MPRRYTPQANLSLGDDLAAEIATRGDIAHPGGVVRQMIERYLAVLAAELRTVTLTVAEASLIVDALNGTLTDPPETARLLWAGVDDAIRLDGLAAKWGVDGPALVERLRSLSFAQALSLIDATERFWRLAENTDRDAALRAVGLVR